MAGTTGSPDQANGLARTTSTEPQDTSAQLVPGKKRSASDSELRANDAGGEQTGDASLRSPKRVKGDEAANGSEDGASPTDSPAVQAAKAHGGWNRGVSSGGLRTSFAGKNKPTALSRQVSQSPVQPAADAVDVERLTMPSGEANFPTSARGKSWRVPFSKWCVRLMALNKDQNGLQDPSVLREAWALWLETRTSLSRAHRDAAVAGAKQTDLDAEKLKTLLSEAQGADLRVPWLDSQAESVQGDSPKSEQQSVGQVESSKPSPNGSLNGSQEGSDWTFPPPPSSSAFELSPRDQSGWEEKFKAWCTSLIQLNNDNIKVGTTRERNRLTEQYLRWIGTIDGLSKNKASAARRAAVHYAQDNSALLVALFAGAAMTNGLETTESAAPPQEQEEGEITASRLTATELEQPDDESDVMPDEDSAELREKYFPGVDPNEPFCHLCASHGHDAVACPQATCRFCGDSQHRSFSCPTRQRCTKCKQLGHTKRDCTEKLALPREERECAFCGSRDHEDAYCHELWRSFVFQPDAVRKVNALPVYCYCCGRDGHYGGVCGLNPQKPKEGPWETWCQTNVDRYLDPASPEIAVIYAVSAPAPARSSDRPDLGKSIVPQRHIFFEEADDDDDADEFIRPPVQKHARVGHISFSGSNSSGVNRNGPSRGSGYNAQPPLPHGLPPRPPPPPNYQDRRNGGRRRGGGGGTRY